jgi:magnesium transporter
MSIEEIHDVKEALRIRRIGEDKETISTLLCHKRDRKLEGVVTVKDMLLAEEENVIGELMIPT